MRHQACGKIGNSHCYILTIPYLVGGKRTPRYIQTDIGEKLQGSPSEVSLTHRKRVYLLVHFTFSLGLMALRPEGNAKWCWCWLQNQQGTEELC